MLYTFNTEIVSWHIKHFKLAVVNKYLYSMSTQKVTIFFFDFWSFYHLCDTLPDPTGLVERKKNKKSHTGQGHVGKHQLNMGQWSKRGEWVCYSEEAEKEEESQEERGKEWECLTCEGDDPTPRE